MNCEKCDSLLVSGGSYGDAKRTVYVYHCGSCGHTWSKETKVPDKPKAFGDPPHEHLDAGWGAHEAGLERETVQVLSNKNALCVLGWDIREIEVKRMRP